MDNVNTMKDAFDRWDTAFAKGIAILVVMFHHLVWQPPDIVIVSDSIKAVQHIARFYPATISVVVFIILSGYGLSESVKIEIGLKKFYIQRLVRIYSSYWIIWIVFVPIGILFFHRSLSFVYGDPIHILLKLPMDFLGLLCFFDVGYNATWWFISLILALYFLFPMLWVLVRKFKTLFLCLSAVFLSIHTKFSGIYMVSRFVFPFVLGIYMSQTCIFSRLMSIKGRKAFAISIVWVMGLVFSLLASVLLDTFIMGNIGRLSHEVKLNLFLSLNAFFTIMTGWKISHGIKWVRLPIAFIGKHSYNMFLFHTFVYNYYGGYLIYSLGSVAFMFPALLVSCLLISFIIEKTMELLRFEAVYKRIKKLQIKDSIIIGGQV